MVDIKFLLSILIFIGVFNISHCEPPSRIIIGTQNNKKEIHNDCEQFEILTNYKHISINISKIKNLDIVLITDKIIENCEGSNFANCREDANICQIRSVNNDSEINFDTKMCIGSIYVIVKKDLYSNNSMSENDEEKNKYSFEISTSYITGGSCSYKHDSSFAYCGEGSLEACRECKKPGCTIIQCGNESQSGATNNNNAITNFNKLYELCIPHTGSDEEKLNRCLSFNDVTTYKSTGYCEFDDLDGYSSLTVFIIGLSVIFVLVFSIAVIYYNVYLIKYQTAPFSVPNFLPEFLFPRKDSETSKRRTTIDNTLDDVFTRDNRANF